MVGIDSKTARVFKAIHQNIIFAAGEISVKFR